MGFDEILERWNWCPIRNCPGRYVLRERRKISVIDIVGGRALIGEHRVATARDVVVVVQLDRGGLICYRRDDGSLVHTLNTSEGFNRKLTQLGIYVCESLQSEPRGFSALGRG